ncbi:MAG: extracellular solute-binding protein [Ruminococcus sp.]|nr:extracellular solute-binding protein [Ruminococcus sp.]
MKKMFLGKKFYIGLIFLFLYAPIAVLIAYSFNASKSSVWSGFTFDWYIKLFQDKAIMTALGNTLLVAVLAAAFSTILGTVASLGMYNLKGAKRKIIQTVSNIPIINPEIVTGISLMLLFVFLGQVFHFENGFGTLLLSHIGFCTPYVILSVTPKLRQMDNHLFEAAQDLGCTQLQAFFQVVIHELLPGIVSGFLISFTYSLDDFIISFFTSGKFQTLPIEIYTMLKKRVSPKINALSTILFVVIFSVLIITNIYGAKQEKNGKEKGDGLKGKKLLCVAMAVLILFGGLVVYSRCANYTAVLNVFNWGENIANGEDGTLDVIAEFEKRYNVKVNYNEYESNEEMYAKIQTESYDVIIPSDYMIGKLIAEDMLLPLDFDNIPNYKNIADEYKNLPYDPDNTYSVPYTWGVVALCYNKDMVKGEVTGFDALWNEDNKGQILMFNNSRDALAIAMQRLGLDPSNPTMADIDKACALLKEQKPLVQNYVMDQVYDLMECDQSAIAPYYAGDIYYMMDNNESLDYCLPEEGTNFFVDAMCVPKNAENPELAEAFINFMLEPEVGRSNSVIIGYASPNSEAVALLPEEIRNNELIYPSKEYLDKCYMYSNTPADIYNYMQEKFIEASTS